MTAPRSPSDPATADDASPGTGPAADPDPGDRRGGISRLEIVVAALVAVGLVGIVLAEPDVVEAPFASPRAILFTVGGTALAAVALVVMLRLRVPPVVRVVVLGVPFAVTSWWLISPYFTDDVVDDAFSTSIAEAGGTTTTADPVTTAPPGSSSEEPPASTTGPTTTVPDGPQLLGAGSFVGLAGHEGTGDAGFFALPDGSRVLRLERFDIENGPDLRLYVVPGADQVDLAEGAVDLGPLRGNVGDQTYDLPEDLTLAPGDWTVLVWCEAFSVEFVGATVAVAG